VAGPSPLHKLRVPGLFLFLAKAGLPLSLAPGMFLTFVFHFTDYPLHLALLWNVPLSISYLTKLPNYQMPCDRPRQPFPLRHQSQNLTADRGPAGPRNLLALK